MVSAEGQVSNYFAPGHIVGGRYKIVRPLGSGGMASVYLAEDIVLGESTVAIKVLRRGGQFRDDLIQRFLREVRLTHKINHENVVRTFDFGQDGDTLFYTMEHLAGATLESLVAEERLPIETVLGIALQLMRGLSAIHAVGVIHRDLKPANIIMVQGGKLKIADFGIAKGGSSMLTSSSGEIVGTIIYLAPETLTGEEATVAVDYYALGVLLYQLLTGQIPIEDEVPARLIMRKVEEAPQDPQILRPDIPNWLAKGLMGLLEIDPQVRMRALTSFAADLDKHAPKTLESTLVSGIVADTLSIDRVLMDQPLHTRFLRRVRRAAVGMKAMIAILAGLLMMPLSTTETASRIEFSHIDSLFVFRGVRAPRSDVVVISIDESSYQNLGVSLASPWPRALHTKLLSKMAGYGPRKVVFDILFVDPSADAQVDEELATAIGKVPTILGAASGLTQQATLNGSYMLEELLKPAPIFADKAADIGVVGLPTQFGRVRNILVERSEMFPDVLSLAEVASGIKAGELHPDSRAFVNYYGPARTISTVPYYMVVSEEKPLPQEVFKDKVVFVGLNLRSRTGPSQREAFVTPFDGATFGTEVHATATSNLLSKDWLRRLSEGSEMVIGICISAIFTFLLITASGYTVLIYVTGTAMLVLGSQYLAFLLGLIVPVVTPLGFGLFCGLLSRIMLSNPLMSASRWKH